MSSNLRSLLLNVFAILAITTKARTATLIGIGVTKRGDGKAAMMQEPGAGAMRLGFMRNRWTLPLLLGLIALALAGTYTGARIQVDADRRWPTETVSAAIPQAPSAPADLVLKNANIYTVDAVRRWAQALAVRDGRLVYVGTDDGVRGLIGPRTRLIDLDGRLVLPGFHDSHAHPIAAGVQSAQCDLTKARSIFDVMNPWIAHWPPLDGMKIAKTAPTAAVSSGKV